MSRELDVVILGATGFTGALAANYLSSVVERASRDEVPPHPTYATLPLGRERDYHHRVAQGGSLSKLRWGLAGRDARKLESLVASLRGARPTVVARVDTNDRAQVDALTRRTRVVCSFAGPFTELGSVVVERCAANGTHYVDITGEIPWVARMAREHDAAARRSGALIIPMCGFDCVPSDLAVLYAVCKLRERGCSSVREARAYAAMTGSFSGGTLRTGIMMERDPEMSATLRNPFALGGGPVDAAHLASTEPLREAVREPALGGAWLGSFMMEELNTRVVRRSASLLEYRARAKGGFAYGEASIHPTKAKADKSLQPGPPADVRQAMVDAGRLPKPGEGPTLAQRRRAWFQMLCRARGEDEGQEVWVSVTGGDGGYEDTALFAVEAALALALAQFPPGRHGVLTPASGLGTALIERLQAAGVRFVEVTSDPASRTRSSL